MRVSCQTGFEAAYHSPGIACDWHLHTDWQSAGWDGIDAETCLSLGVTCFDYSRQIARSTNGCFMPGDFNPNITIAFLVCVK